MEIPSNLSIIKEKGTRSFVEINYQNKRLHLLDHVYAPLGKELPEGLFEFYLKMAVGYANLHKDYQVSYIRYDLEKH